MAAASFGRVWRSNRIEKRVSDPIEEVIFRHESDLQQELMREANTRGADLSGANLWGATGMSNKELERRAASLKGATMPEGQKYEDWVKEGRPPRSRHKRSRS
jgi:hypothetical protein